MTAQIPDIVDYRKDLLPVTDQTINGNCLASASATVMEWREFKNTGTKKYIDPIAIYSQRQESHELDMSDIARILNVKCVSLKSIDEVKNVLSESGPCIINLQMYNRTSRMWYPIDSKRVIGMHSMCIVGYNADGFIIRNSWGEKWGNNGYCVFPYEDWKWKWEIITFK